MSSGVGDLLPHLLVLGEPHSDSPQTFCHRKARGNIQEVSPPRD